MLSFAPSIFQQKKLYHICNYVMDGSAVFQATEDASRFVFQMYAAGVGRPVLNLHRRDISKAVADFLDDQKSLDFLVIKEHPPLVKIISFALAGNRFNLCLNPVNDESLMKYLQKLKTGFSKYFNIKHKKRGNLFERSYRSAPVKTEAEFAALLFYINLKSVLDAWKSERERVAADSYGGENARTASYDQFFEFAENYRFSSFPHLFGNKDYPLMAPKNEIENYWGEELSLSKEEARILIDSYVNNKMSRFKHLFLEN